jgi:hypothetical protein
MELISGSKVLKSSRLLVEFSGATFWGLFGELLAWVLPNSSGHCYSLSGEYCCPRSVKILLPPLLLRLVPVPVPTLPRPVLLFIASCKLNLIPEFLDISILNLDP